jgi:hypothetical protein
MNIVHISAVKRNESKNINLVAVTSHGMRLYFSINQFEQLQFQQQQQQQHQLQTQQQMQTDIIDLNNISQKQQLHQQSQQQQPQQTSNAPTTFQLVHVRIPPNMDISAKNRHGQVTTAFINDGVSVIVSKRDENSDSVLLLNRDLFMLHSNFKESKSFFDIDGRVWCIDEVIPSLTSIKTCAVENELLQTAKSASGTENVPKLTSEFFDCSRRFVMVTPQVFFWFILIFSFCSVYFLKAKLIFIFIGLFYLE